MCLAATFTARVVAVGTLLHLFLPLLHAQVPLYAPVRTQQEAPITKLSLDQYPTARCLDGTPGAYFLLQGDPSSFVINMAGGGTCYHQWSCNVLKYSAFGSSDYMPVIHHFQFSGTLTDINPTRNPQLASATMVHIPYCSGDLYSGQTQQASANTNHLWFGGHNIVMAVVAELMAMHGLGKANQVVLTGGSAGGMGTVLHLDLLADTLKKAGNDHVRVVGAPRAGFTHLQQTAYTGPTARAGFRLTTNNFPQIAQWWQSYVPERCAAEQQRQNQEEWKCLLTSVSAHARE